MVFHLGAPGGVPASSGYSIARSLRFNDDDSAYLSRTPGGAGNTQLWTLSFWMKRGTLGTTQSFFSAGNGSGIRHNFSMTSSDTIQCSINDSTTWYEPTTSAVLRDVAAWYHVLIAFDGSQATAANRLKLFVNNSQLTFTSGTIYPQSTNTSINSTSAHNFARNSNSSSQFFDGYLADLNLIDGQALDPSYFGETDATSGAWKPKRYTGSYGTNGFFLSFANNASTTTLGYDDGTGAVGAGAGSNDWTLNNFSVAAGSGNDSLTDTPTNNYCTLLPTVQAGGFGGANTYANGGLDVTTSASVISAGLASIGVSSGKRYWEVTVNSATGTPQIGVSQQQIGTISTNGLYQDATSYAYLAGGNKGNNNSASAYGSSYTAADVISVALDMNAGKVWFAKNGTWQSSGDPAAGTGEAYSGLSGTYFPSFGDTHTTNTVGLSFNFGQRDFSYSAPTGFSALCTANLPTPAIQKPSAQFNAVTYTGTGSSLAITGVGHQPDLVWIKGRSGATDHALYDAVRGVQNQLESNTTTDETVETTGLTAFGSDGFTIGALAQVNTNAATYVAWCWNEGSTPGFDIVTYTGNGANRTIAHDIGAAPNFIIVKARTTAGTDQGWAVYHSANTSAPATDYLLLNSTAATADLDTLWNDTAPTSSVFSVGTNALVNTTSDTYVAYLWSEVPGFSQFGSYTGNANADGPFVWCGFRPRFVLAKCTSTTGSWWLFDAARGTANVISARVIGEGSAAETTSATIDLLSNGFKLRTVTADPNAAQTYVFAAFAEMPFKTANAR